MPRPTKPSTLINTLLLPLVLRQSQLCPCIQGRLCHNPDRGTEIVYHDGGLGNAP